MAATTAEDRLRRAQELRKLAKQATTSTLRNACEAAATRLEKSAARALTRIGKRITSRR